MGVTVDANESLAQHRLVQDAQQRHVILFQRDQRAPFVAAGDEGAGAIDRIEHPTEAGRAGLFAIFLAQDGVVRALAVDDGADGAFGATIGLGDGIEAVQPLFVRHIDALAEKGPDRCPAGIGQAARKLDGLVINGHGAILLRLPQTGQQA